jgi:hypothetical protein
MANRKNTFLIKRSNIAGKIPAAGDLQLGELALNTADNILYASGTTANSILPIGWDRVARTGDTMTGSLYAPSIYATTISATTYLNLPPATFSGGTVTGPTNFTNGLTANTMSATTYYGDGSNLTGISAVATEFVVNCRNQSGSNMYRGQVVYMNGSTGNKPTILLAQANSEMTSARTFGVLKNDIANNGNGDVVTIGSITNLDTRTSATHPFTIDTLSDGQTIYLSPTNAGYITNVKPYAPNHLVYIGKVVRTSPTNGYIEYQIQNGYELDELHDVKITGVTYGDLLTYSAYNGSNVWVNSKTLNGSYTVTGDTSVGGQMKATTVSATTYYNLPTDIRVTGGTYSNNTFTYTNNTGGTFSTLFNTMTGLTITGNLTVTGGTQSIFSGNSSSDLVRITQTGTGNAFVIEDSNNPDSTPFVIDANGRVGIGGVSLSEKLNIDGNVSLISSASTKINIESGAGVKTYLAADGAGTSFGSLSNHDVVFYRNNSEFARRTETGFGIGTTTPGANLEVYGVSDSVALIKSAGNSYLKLNRGILAADAHISFDTTTTQKHIIGLINNTDSLIVGGTEAAPVITVSGSNVGIGTTTPSEKLVVNGNAIITGSITVTGGTQSLFSGNSSVEMVKIIQAGSGDAFVVQDQANGDPSHFVINASGNTAIGLTAPIGNDKLTVSGNTTVYGTLSATTYTGAGINNGKILAITELTASTLATHTVASSSVFTVINCNSDATNRYAKTTFTAPSSGIVEITVNADIIFLNSSAVQMIGLHSTTASTTTPDKGWFRINGDADGSSASYSASFILSGLTPSTIYSYYVMTVCDFSGNIVRCGSRQTGAYVSSADRPSPLRIYVRDIGTTTITTNPSS